MFSKLPYKGAGNLWSMGWVIVIRLILYMVIAGFLIQYIYFRDRDGIYEPNEALALLAAVFFLDLVILAFGAGKSYIDILIAFTYAGDLAVLTWIILSSGGFSSVFIPYYIPFLVMATAWLPRKLTAVFPSIATLGTAYIGLAHLVVAEDEMQQFSSIYPMRVMNLLRISPAHAIVANMLILTVLFFIVSYLSSILSNKLFHEQRLNAEVLSSMKEGVAVVSVKGTLAYANSEFLRLFPEAAVQEAFSPVAESLFKPEEDGVSLEKLLEKKPGSTLVLARETKSGKRTPVEVRIFGINLRGEANLFGLVFLVSDLSLRKRIEEAERDIERFAAISTMATGLAHEIRNPLASLRSAIQEIGESFSKGSANQILADIVIAESDRLDGVIGRFLDFSREGKLRPSQCRLGDILTNLKTLLRHAKEAEETEIEVVIKDDPPVVCDVDRLKEVFFNLALNAAQVMPHSGGRLRILLESADSGMTPGVEIKFMDNGPGLDKNEQARIFEPFYSLRPGGTGMGLPISRKQVEMHGGEMTVGNNPEGGACFRVWLPLQQGVKALRNTRILGK